VIEEVNTLVAAGYLEIVLSGINLGRWGLDLENRLPASGFRSYDVAEFSRPEGGRRKPNFPSLLRAILDETKIEKIRISSVEPMDWSDELIKLVADSPRIAKHAHVPLQSASDAVLRRMHRKYRPWHYREKIEKIRAAMPTAAIGADVMVGFPGENEAEFEETRRFIEELPFTYLHVFTFSARPGTPAAAMRNQVPVHIARERNKILRELAGEKKQAFMRGFIGQTMDAITLSHSADISIRDEATTTQIQNKIFRTEALTDNFQKLFLAGRHAPNQWRKAQIEKVIDGAFIASAA
jgi:threonylcarbamoyladenosine tRNA methylthiotransferase MtaB